MKRTRIFFDKKDVELLNVVNDVLAAKNSSDMKKLLQPFLHPHGIKEMAAPTSLRIAYAVIHLLGSLEKGKVKDRLNALKILRDEVMYFSAGTMRKNTARALVQIMKELVRSTHDPAHQLCLSRDFRETTTGKAHTVNAQLEKYHLIPIPEDSSQFSFDDHVHDANTKGRKSATHLVMDAWIKGIQNLTVIYYNYVEPRIVQELLEAASIMEVNIRIGIQFSTLFRKKYVNLIWEPNFATLQDYTDFLQQSETRSLMEQGKQVSRYQAAYFFSLLEAFNQTSLERLNQDFAIDLPPLGLGQFKEFVGTGQPSQLHLAKFIYDLATERMWERIENLREAYQKGSPEEQGSIKTLVDRMNSLDSETIIERYLHPDLYPALQRTDIPPTETGASIPELLLLSPVELTRMLNKTHSGSHVTLNLQNLTLSDVIEVLFTCHGKITHLEIFNLKDNLASCVYEKNKQQNALCNLKGVNTLQEALNTSNVVALKKTIRSALWEVSRHVEEPALSSSERHDLEEQKEKLLDILFSIPDFLSFYSNKKLNSRIGSGSTGRSRHHYGMGLVIRDTLPARTQKILKRSSRHIAIPVSADIKLRLTNPVTRHASPIKKLWKKLTGLVTGSGRPQKSWVIDSYHVHETSSGNIMTLGGVQQRLDNGLSLTPPQNNKKQTLGWRYLNTTAKNTIKCIAGFIPATLTFMYTQDWWLLAWFGALIWFSLTGLRNIIQSVLGGGGFRRSPLLRWNDYVSWNNIANSLFFTGFSVPLLELLLKNIILDQTFSITTETSPFLLYSIMAITNGCYIVSHNMLRGFGKGAMFGNFFRSILSIPLAIFFNTVLAWGLGLAGVVAASACLQPWAAIISKFSSECVAGVIEGLADRSKNMASRILDYKKKLRELLQAYAQLEVHFPEEDILEMLEAPKDFFEVVNFEASDLEKVIIINALDLLYLWMYQPRARYVLKSLMRDMSMEERQIFVRSQFVLLRKREISQLFLDGIVGKNFSNALSFYLERSQEYLDALTELAKAYSKATK